MRRVLLAFGAVGASPPTTVAPTTVALVLLAFAWLMGLAHVALLPPWEGFDETGHFSSIAQIAAGRGIPQLGHAHIAAAAEAYAAVAPMPYPSAPPFGGGATRTYRDLAADPAGVRAVAALLDAPPVGGDGGDRNWQAQHPPLYYLLMAGPARLLAPRGLGVELFGLRLLSYSIAFAALAAAVWANRRLSALAAATAAAWPLLFPMWFPEMARLGNDGLCALELSLAWGLILRVPAEGRGLGHAVRLGLVTAAGLSTKVFFVPIAAFLAIWLVAAAPRRHRLARLSAFAAVAVVLGSPWYLRNLLAGLPLLGANDLVTLAGAGGLLAGLRHHLSPAGVVHAAGTIVRSFLWAGTWSLARPPLGFILPLAALAALLAAGWAGAVGAREDRRRALLPLLLIAPMLATLAFHALVWLALGKAGVTPGWYLHILAAPASAAAAAGLARFGTRRGSRLTVAPLAAYAFGFGAAMVPVQALLFAGCVGKAPPSGLYAWWGCPSAATAALTTLARPGLAAAAAVAALIFGVAGLVGWLGLCAQPPAPAAAATGAASRARLAV